MTCALTTLAHVKAWLGIAPNITTSDAMLERLIQSASRFALSLIQRKTVCVIAYNELYDGNGKNWMLLKQWPIQSIESIITPGQTITTLLANSAMSGGPGFKINPPDSPDEGPQRITLWNACLPLGRDTVNVNYTAGFKQVDELTVYRIGTDPDFEYTVDLTQTWAGGLEVRDHLGILMLEVDANPGPGEYTLSDEGVYKFNVAANTTVVTVTYSYVPADLEQAVYELVGEAMRYKERIGVKSKTLGGQETIVYDNSMVNDRCSMLLQNYRRVAPI